MPSPTTTPSASASPQYRDSFGNLYIFLPSNATAPGAQAACQGLGPTWNAVAVSDADTESAIKPATRCGGNPSAVFPFWTGGYDTNPSGGYANGQRNYPGWAWTSNVSNAYFLSRQDFLFAP